MTEIFSPPKISARARARGLRRGWNLDNGAICLVTGEKWDLLNMTEQNRARNWLEKTKPQLLIASPPFHLPRIVQGLSSCFGSDPEKRHTVGALDKAMYGTKDAPAAWEAELEKTMVKLGFRPVVSSLCLCYHPSFGISVVGHVDDLMCVGPRCGLDIFLARLNWRRTGRNNSWAKNLLNV